MGKHMHDKGEGRMWPVGVLGCIRARLGLGGSVKCRWWLRGRWWRGCGVTGRVISKGGGSVLGGGAHGSMCR